MAMLFRVERQMIWGGFSPAPIVIRFAAGFVDEANICTVDRVEPVVPVARAAPGAY